MLSWNCKVNRSGADELLGIDGCSIWLVTGVGNRYIGGAAAGVEGGPLAGDGIIGGISALYAGGTSGNAGLYCDKPDSLGPT
jgi:hypothetical protein